MSFEKIVLERCQQQCELCGSSDQVIVVGVAPFTQQSADNSVALCQVCAAQVAGEQELDHHHWRCLNDSMWSQEQVVQVLAWRMLKRLSSEGWAQDLLDMMYLDDDAKTWAESGLVDLDAEPTLDSNGARLQTGDTVTLIKDLDVKGAGFTAKRGTAVRGISLTDNPKHIEGRVNGTRIVIIAEYCKKA